MIYHGCLNHVSKDCLIIYFPNGTRGYSIDINMFETTFLLLRIPTQAFSSEDNSLVSPQFSLSMKTT